MNQGQLFYVVRESSIAPVISLPQMDGENIDPRRILHFLETLHLDNYPFPTECNPPVSVDLSGWERPKTPIPEKKWSPQTPFCPGCGLGILRNTLVEGISELNLPREKMVIVSGIGCTARLPNHLPFDSANTTHGYPLPFATGVKMTQPDLNVVVVSGDGDLFDIGLGQTLHGARRDLPMLTICFNNFVFGMTGGQVGPTTPMNAVTLTTTQGNKKPPIDLVKLMLDLNVGFAARCPISKPLVLKRNIKDALSFKGFSFIEVVSPCLTCYCNKNKIGSQYQIWQKLNQTYIDKQQIKNLSVDVLKEKYNLLFPNRTEIQPQEMLQMVYGEFSTLQEYIDLVPEAK
jgi:2-oxoglutarate ferredoxin oxidoreductase subunit beta